MIRQELWMEACEMLSLTVTEQRLAEKLLDGPMELRTALSECGSREEFSFSPVFGHSDDQIFLYPEFVCYVNGELPDSGSGSLPEGMTLEFPEQHKIYGGEELTEEIAGLFCPSEKEAGAGDCVILSGKEGTGFLARQTAWRMARPVLFWNGEKESDHELLLTAILYDAFVCLDLRGQSEDLEDKLKMGARISTQGLDVLILTDHAGNISAEKLPVPVLVRTVSVPDEQIRREYITDYLTESGLTLQPYQQSRLAEEPFSIAVLKAILGELRLEAKLNAITETVFNGVFSRYKKESTAEFGIRRMTANRTLNDLCLPEEQHRKLENICAMLKNREKVMEQWGFGQKYSYGNGISILLYGVPGTGKTMAAQVIASELNMPLYRVDLSALISKYIGETQKNIAKIFDQAKQLNGILLFDEADALFSRRNEVSDAQDKYANAETAYLLQRIEESEGICILTTNLLQNFDEAFRRRITYMIHFPMPDEALREQIWRNVFPKEAPLSDDINLQLLAEKFELSGASIRNAAVQSAWNASIDQDSIRMRNVLDSIENEYRKMNKVLKPEQKALIESFD